MSAPTSHTRAWRRYAPAAAIAVALAAFFACGLDKRLSLEQLVESHVALRAAVAAHWTLALAMFVAGYALLVAISAPGATVLTIAAGALFGLWPGAAASAVGATLGACTLFLAARSSLGHWLAVRAAPSIARLRGNFCQHATGYLLFLRLSPLFPFWFVNLAAALAGVGFVTFLWTTAVGIMPATFIFAATGASLDRIVAASAAARAACIAAGQTGCGMHIPLSAVVTPQIFLLLIGLSLVALAPVAAKRFRAAREGEPAA